MSIVVHHNSDQILNELNKLLDASSNLEPAMRAITGVFLDATEEAFANEASPSGEPWADLSDTTKAFREARGKWPGQILQVSQGGLASSISTDYGSDYAMIGTNKIYGPMMHFGGDTSPESMIPNKEIPGREFLGLGPDDEDEILQILGRFLTGS